MDFPSIASEAVDLEWCKLRVSQTATDFPQWLEELDALGLDAKLGAASSRAGSQILLLYAVSNRGLEGQWFKLLEPLPYPDAAGEDAEVERCKGTTLVCTMLSTNVTCLCLDPPDPIQ